MPNLPKLLNELNAEFRRRRPKFAQALREGTPRHVLVERLLEKNLAPGAELLNWYQWSDGVALGESSIEPELIPGYLFPSFERALILYEAFATATASTPSDYWQDGWFPIFDDLAGGGLMLPAAKHATDPRLYMLTEGSASEPAFDSFEAMVYSMIECYRTGAYTVTADEKLEERSDLSRHIYQKRNPTSPVWK